MESLITFLDGLTIWHWWILAAVLLVCELLTGTTYLLWPTASAFVVGLIAATLSPFAGWEVQLIAFAALTTITTLAGDKFVSKRWFATDKPMLNERSEQVAGEKVIATAAFVAGEGRVRFGDSVWSAEMVDGGDAAEGAILEVVRIEGATLMVRAPEAAAPTDHGEPGEPAPAA
ncbi:MAG: NfeD family protein [Maricaulaceae bacterium]|jgi:membrane protein implicated in regulation of membrane protease activity